MIAVYIAVYVVGFLVTLITTALIYAKFDADGWEYINFSGIALGCLCGVVTGFLWPLTVSLSALAWIIYFVVKKLIPMLARRDDDE